MFVWKTQVRFLVIQAFSLLNCIQTEYGTHPAAYLMGTRLSFHGVKAEGA
jgi:hypothetical protein